MADYRVRIFQTNQGARIYQLPLKAFTDFWVYAYLIDVDGTWLLIDTGSGFYHANEDLDAGFQIVGEMTGREVTYGHLSYILITHSHIDHFGGLPYLLERTDARVGVHELDMRNLTNIDERLTLVSRRLDQFLAEAGVPDELRQRLVQIHRMSKLDYTSVPVDFTYNQHTLDIDGLRWLHVPGHCPGQVVFQLHDILFSADQVLSHTTPHQAPERLTLHTGLSHYLDSLDLLDGWTNGVTLTLPGHEDPIEDLHRRIEEIKGMHQQRLEKVFQLTDHPMTVAEISGQLFKEVDGYDQLLALEEAGAHVEYLYQRGQFGIANYEDIDRSAAAIPWKYYRL